MSLHDRILVSESQGEELRRLLNGLNYETSEINSIDEIIFKALNENPSLIIGDFKKMGKPLNEICHIIKNHMMLRHIPLIVVTENGEIKEKIAAVESGASDYIVKPYEKDEVMARIRRSINDMRMALNANPLTKLPGNIAIQEKLEWMISTKQSFAVAYLDIDHFKSYNDLYGYTAGDQIISLAGTLLMKIKEMMGSLAEDAFIGHVGGDDFILICPEEIVEGFCKHFIMSFDQRIPAFYDKETQERGVIIGRDRKGNVTAFPLVSVSISVVINEGGIKYNHMGEIACAGAEVKKYLKGIAGSTYLIDRRH